MTAADSCKEKTGPNCGLCICKLSKGHDGQHENWHGTLFGKRPDSDQLICKVCKAGRHDLCDEEDQRVPHHCDCTHADSDQRGEGTWHVWGDGKRLFNDQGVGYHAVIREDNIEVALTFHLEDAERIVADHNAVSTLREQKRLAVEALTSIQLHGYRGGTQATQALASITALDEAHTPQARDEETK